MKKKFDSYKWYFGYFWLNFSLARNLEKHVISMLNVFFQQKVLKFEFFKTNQKKNIQSY